MFRYFRRSDRIVRRFSILLPALSRLNDTWQTVLRIIRSRTLIARDTQRIDIRNVSCSRRVFGRRAVRRRFLIIRLLLLRKFYRPLRPRWWTPDRVAHRTARCQGIRIVVNVTINRACVVTNRIRNAISVPVVMYLAAIVKPIG